MKKFALLSALALGVSMTAAVAQDVTKGPDSAVNTKRNAKKHGPTADDQTNNEADRKMDADIRKAVVDDNSLSMMAHNVKIITRNGHVTLRGHVKSNEEKNAIAAKAEEVAGKGKVTNRLMVTSGSDRMDQSKATK